MSDLARTGDLVREDRFRHAQTRTPWPLVLIAALLVRLVMAGDFEFVVVGDTRPRFESENFRIFEGLITKITEIKPSFVVNLGDLIYGYGLPGKERQWDRYEQVIRAIQVPYYQVPGNHDTHSKDARRIYARRFGKFYGSFDHGDCHFVLLDNTDELRWGYIGQAELAWLQKDLRETRARSIFVFLHFPVWESERMAAEYHAFWVRTLHPLFRQSRVKAVFGGHFHSYGPTRELDGIRYFITGGGGAELKPGYRKAGGGHHFLRVRVTGEDFDVRVVTDRGEQSDAEADVMGGLAFADRNSSRIGIAARDVEPGRELNCSISLTNPEREYLVGQARWRQEGPGFSAKPSSWAIQVPPGETRIFPFTLRARAKGPTAGPLLEFNVSAGKRQYHFVRETLFLPQLPAPEVGAAPTIDGRLEDWQNGSRLRLDDAGSAPVEVQAVHTQGRIFLAVSLPSKEANRTVGAPAVRDELRLGLAQHLGDTRFGGDLIRLGLSGKDGEVRIEDRTPGRLKAATIRGVLGAYRRQAGRATYEIAIPSRLLKTVKAGKEPRLILSLAYPAAIPDGGNPTHESQDLDALSQEVRYGGDALAPVHFLEMVFGAKRTR